MGGELVKIYFKNIFQKQGGFGFFKGDHTSRRGLGGGSRIFSYNLIFKEVQNYFLYKFQSRKESELFLPPPLPCPIHTHAQT